MHVLYILPKMDYLLYWTEKCHRERVKLFTHKKLIPRCFWKAATRGSLSNLSTWNEIVGFSRGRWDLWLVGYPWETCKMKVRIPQHDIHDPANRALKSWAPPDTSAFRCHLPAILRYVHFPEHTLLVHASVLSSCSSLCLECPSPTFLCLEKNILIFQNLVQLPWFLLILPWPPPARN